MNLKILWIIVFYYGFISLFFILGGSLFSNYHNPLNLNTTNMTAGEQDTGGLFSTGISFGRFFSLITIGIGLPIDTPSWFAVMFAIWQTMFLILSIGFVISSIWDG